MKTSEIQRMRNNVNIQNAHKLIKSQTKSARVVSGPSQPVVPGKVEPAVFDIAFIKNVWQRLVKNVKG